MSQYQALEQALRELEAAMRAGNMWRQDEPTPQELASREPFCTDTMNLPQWLRFVLVTRLKTMIDARQPLPSNADMAPAAELYLTQYSMGAKRPVVEAVKQIDNILNGIY